MSSAVISSAAQGRPFVLDEEDADKVRSLSTGNNRGLAAIKEAFATTRSDQSQIKSRMPPASVMPASHLAVRPVPEMVSSGIAEMDALTGGLPRGCLTEICGPASSGRTTLLLSAVAAATRRGEFCAVVDASDALDPQSAAAAGIELDRLLWVRCGKNSSQKKSPAAHRKDLGTEKNIFNSNSHAEHRHAEQSLEQLLRVTDLLLESGGFGLIALDFGDLPPQTARRIPLTTWFRFRRAVEHTPTVLLAIEPQSSAGSCSSLLIKMKSIKMGSIKMRADGNLGDKQRINLPCLMPAHTQLLSELEITAEIVRSRMDRKPVRSAEITFTSKTAWAG
jgi:recombination protein RecA